ncbi:MAG: 4Fe-4S binding protein [Candidatus Omnitrophica bacterium]|nr:4Fe-4S binding protein [Candidatus Omnitrophota bacterium]
MAHKISSDCISCGSCESQCPVNAIVKGESIYTINAETCVDCGACVSACPVNAISSE